MDFTRLNELMDMGGGISLAAMKDLSVDERGELERRWAAARPPKAAPEQAAPVGVVAKSPTTTTRPDPAREAEGNRLAALMAEWKKDEALKKRFPSRGDYLVDQGWDPKTGFASGPGSLAPSQPVDVSGDDPRFAIGERAKAEWDANAANTDGVRLQDEFMSFDSYLAWRKAGSPTGSRSAVVGLTHAERAQARTPRKE